MNKRRLFSGQFKGRVVLQLPAWITHFDLDMLDTTDLFPGRHQKPPNPHLIGRLYPADLDCDT
jgi:hypothetical protein